VSAVRAFARVRVTVEFALGGGPWSDKATVEEIHRQARESAMGALRRGLVIEGLVSEGRGDKTVATVVGEPAVTAILVEQEHP